MMGRWRENLYGIKGCVPDMIPLVYNPKIQRYHFGGEHPFFQDRYSDFVKVLKQQDYMKYFSIVSAEKASLEDILSVHTPEYVQKIVDLEGKGSLTLDTPLPMGISDAGRLLTGHGLKAMELVMTGTPLAVTFGGTHHAGRDYGGGFCLFNDVAIIAQTLMDTWKLERIVILDTDAHHGNGTQDIFYESKKILYISIHQDPRTLYPGTGFSDDIGKGEGRGYTVNIPLLPGSGDTVYGMVFRDIIAPIVHQFDPQVVIRNGGSDVHYLDDLTHLGVTHHGLYAIGEQVRLLASGCNRLIDLTVSGYNRDVLPSAWLSLVCGVCNLEMPQIPPGCHGQTEDHAGLLDATRGVISEVKKNVGGYWDFS